MAYLRSIFTAGILFAITATSSSAGPEGLVVPHIGFTIGAGGIHVDARDGRRSDFDGGGLALGVILSYPYTDRNRVAVEFTVAAASGDTANTSAIALRGVWSHRLSAVPPGFFVRAGGGWSEVRDGSSYAGGMAVLGGIGYAISDRLALHSDFTWGGSPGNADNHVQRGFFFAINWWAI
jgi:hypothetical protein